jgi:GT2 family glycosyltransferase
VAAAPLISVIIATREAAATLPRCLDSLRRQAFRDFEVIVMDAASTDGTVALLQAAGDVVTAWRSEPDTGIYSAWNKALALARGEWFCALGGDDWLWDAQSLERLAPALRAAPPAQRIVYSRVRQVDTQGGLLAELGRPWEECRDAFRSYACLPHPGLMHRRSLWTARGFDERFRLAGDYEFLLRELKTGDAVYVPAVTAGQQFGGRTTSPEHFLAMYREIGEALRLHGLAPPRLRWAWFLSSAWLYRWLHALLGDRGARRLADLYRRATFRRPRYLTRE